MAPGRVELVNAQRAGAANADAVARAVAGDVRLLYVSPERFGSPRFAEAIARARVGLFVVDEAHCISQWGHDFRPDYFFLADVARRLGARATIGLTATATPEVADDIARRLAMRDPVRITTGFDRPNLSFAVARCGTTVDKRRRLAAALKQPEALPAIVYAGTRNATEQLAGFLARALGEEVLAYHAGLERGVRTRTQERFMSGEARVIVATNAFGMGIDKANVRTVCHATVPGSLEAYYQEAGRAGRDGAPARCLLFAEQRDKGLHVFFIQRSRLDAGAFERVAERLRWAGLDGRYDVALAELASVTGPRADEESVRAIIGHLTRAGLIVPQPSPPDRAAGQIVEAWGRRALALCLSSARDAERVRWRQYRAVWQYVEGAACRRTAVLAVFRRSGRRGAVGRLLRRVRAGGEDRRRTGFAGSGAPGGGASGGGARCASAVRGRSRRRHPPGRRLRLSSRGPHPRGRDPPRRPLQGGRPVRLRPARRLRRLRPPSLRRGADAGRPAARGRDPPLHGRAVPEAPAGMNVAVLASGEGTNLQALLDRVHGRDGVRIVAVASDKPGARALERARQAAVATAAFEIGEGGRAQRDRAMAGWLVDQGAELVVLAGYMQLLDPEFLRRFPNGVINVHPALLPAFPGLHAVEQAIAYGVKVFGVTVHYVDEGVDSGPVILQRAVELPDARTASEVMARLQPIEHELLPEAVRLIARDAVRFDEANPRRVAIDR